MKRILVLLILVSALIITPRDSFSVSIDIISQSCSTEGRHYQNPPGDYLSFSQNGTNSVFGIGWGGTVVTSATADVDESTAFLEAWTDIIDNGYAYSEITFQPIEASHINISAKAADSGMASGSVWLIDQTTSESMLSLDSLGGGEGYNYFEGLFPIEQSHIYLLSTLAWVEGSDQAHARADMSLVATPVPDPPTILLLASGLGGLAGFWREFRIHICALDFDTC